MTSAAIQTPLVGQEVTPPSVCALSFRGRPNSGLRITGARRSFQPLWAAISAFFLLVGGIGFVAARLAEVNGTTLGGVWLGVGMALIVAERCERGRRKSVDVVVGRWFFACSQLSRSFAVAEVVNVARVSTDVEVTLADGAREPFFRGCQVEVAEFVAEWLRERLCVESPV